MEKGLHYIQYTRISKTGGKKLKWLISQKVLRALKASFICKFP